jgi:hypothetical protein
MLKFLVSAVRDNGAAGESRHALTFVRAADLAAAELVAAGLYPGTRLELAPAGDVTSSADNGATVTTSTNALDEQAFNAVCGARDMLEDVAGMEDSPPIVAQRLHRQAVELSTMFDLPKGPASDRAAARISELQVRESARNRARGRDPLDQPDGVLSAGVAIAAAAATVAEMGPTAGIQSDDAPAAPAPLAVVAGVTVDADGSTLERMRLEYAGQLEQLENAGQLEQLEPAAPLDAEQQLPAPAVDVDPVASAAAATVGAAVESAIAA